MSAGRCALLLTLFAAPALADSRVEARRHFKVGMALIARGEHAAGIAELKEAYAIRPHPNVLYNIARASQEAGDTNQALEFYRRYLATSPPDAQTVAATVASLEGTPKKEPPPPRPKPEGEVASTERLEELVARMEGALARLEERTPRTAAPGAAASPSPAEGEPEDGTDAPYEERVVTASRHAQSTLDAPNATTLITAEEIRLSGAKSVVELLRRVPGAEVMEMGVASANFSLRGFNQRVSNKVLVLIDGRSEYQDFAGYTLWSALPISVEDIERIEIIRGPGSALYGANAMLGVVNIITKAPGTGPRAELVAKGGTGGLAEGHVSSTGASAGGAFRYRVSGGYQQEQKWSRDFADDRPDVVSLTPDSSLGVRSGRGQLVTQYNFNRDVQLRLSGGVSRVFTEFYALGLLRNFYFDGTNGNTLGELRTGPLRLRFFWNHLGGQTGPQYGPIGLASRAQALQQNVFDTELTYSTDFSLVGRHRLTLGASGRWKRADWDFLEPGLHAETHAAAFVQDEWAFAQPFKLTASYRVDRHPLLNAGSPGLAHSPRVSLVWRPVEGHSFRAAAATAFREPTLLESYTQVRVPLPSINGASVLTEGNRSLKAERLVSFELGYQGELPRLGWSWELTVYQNNVWDLAVLSAVKPISPADSYDPVSGTYLLGTSSFENEGQPVIARGVELGSRISPVDGLSLAASLAFQKLTSSARPCGPCSQAPSYKAFGSVTYRTPLAFELGLEGALTGSTVWIEREPNPLDPTQIQALENPLFAFGYLNARIGYRLFNDRATVALVGSHLGPAHSQHPFGNRIESRVMGTLSVTP